MKMHVEPVASGVVRTRAQHCLIPGEFKSLSSGVAVTARPATADPSRRWVKHLAQQAAVSEAWHDSNQPRPTQGARTWDCVDAPAARGAGQSDRSEGYFDGDGVRLFLVRTGNGPLMVFLHGAPDDWSLYEFQLREFASRSSGGGA